MTTKLKVSTPVFAGNVPTSLWFLDAEWSRSRGRKGNDLDGTFVLAGDLAQLNELFRTWLGYDVQEAESAVPWRGLVWSLTLQHKGISRTISYETIWNAVRAKYRELLQNTGFENYEAGGAEFVGWTVGGSGGGTISPETTDYANGEIALKIEKGSFPAGDLYVYQDVTVVPGSDYRLRFHARGDGTGSGRYRIYDVSNAAVLVALSGTGNTSTTYKSVEVDFMAPAGCTTVRIELYNPSTLNYALFDDCSCQRLVEGEAADSYTDWFTNEQSIARYGRREFIIDAQKSALVDAEIQCQDKLAACAWPRPSKPKVQDEGNQETTLIVECVGYWATSFFRYVYTGTSGYSLAISEVVRVHIVADCDWLDVKAIQTNNNEVRIDPAEEETVGAMLERITADDWRIIVDINRAVIFERIDPAPILFRTQGYLYSELPGSTDPVDAYKVLAGVVVQDMDWPSIPTGYAGLLVNENQFLANEWEVNRDGLLVHRG